MDGPLPYPVLLQHMGFANHGPLLAITFLQTMFSFIFKKTLMAFTNTFPLRIAMLMSGYMIEHLTDVVSDPNGLSAMMLAITTLSCSHTLKSPPLLCYEAHCVPLLSVESSTKMSSFFLLGTSPVAASNTSMAIS